VQVEEDAGETVLVAAVPDQEALHALLDRLRALDLPLVSLARVEPTLEEVFVRLTGEAGEGEAALPAKRAPAPVALDEVAP
jgi:hypothetical protein